MDCTIHVAETKALISFAVTAKLICVFVFAYTKSRFSHDEAHFRRKLCFPYFLPKYISKEQIRYVFRYKQNEPRREKDGWRLEISDLGSRGIVLSV